MDEPYAAINCSDHDRLLACATLRQKVHLTLMLPDGETQVISGVIEDVLLKKRM
jgi:transcriptional antiterminator Rof (Rho-off)